MARGMQRRRRHGVAVLPAQLQMVEAPAGRDEDPRGPLPGRQGPGGQGRGAADPDVPALPAAALHHPGIVDGEPQRGEERGDGVEARTVIKIKDPPVPDPGEQADAPRPAPGLRGQVGRGLAPVLPPLPRVDRFFGVGRQREHICAEPVVEPAPGVQINERRHALPSFPQRPVRRGAAARSVSDHTRRPTPAIGLAQAPDGHGRERRWARPRVGPPVSLRPRRPAVVLRHSAPTTSAADPPAWHGR